MSKHHSTQHEPENRPETPAAPQADHGAQATANDNQAPAATAQDVEVALGAEELTKLRNELKAAKDRELRCHAEMDNYRKRATRELTEQLRYANMGLVRDLLPVLDNVQRAIEAGEKHPDANALLEGFKMVHQQLEDALKLHHVTRIEALHEPFDPNVHHAILQQPSEEHPENTVTMVTQTGYQLHDRVVRPAQVIVSTTTKSE